MRGRQRQRRRLLKDGMAAMAGAAAGHWRLDAQRLRGRRGRLLLRVVNVWVHVWRHAGAQRGRRLVQLRHLRQYQRQLGGQPLVQL